MTEALTHLPNPWVDLPADPPFVLPQDVGVLARFDPVLRDKYQLRLDLLPQPWTGSLHTAEVFLLALNPGFAEADYSEVRNPDYAEQWRRALTFETRTPFYFLDPSFRETGGYRWWHRRLRELIDIAGLDSVAARIMCVENFPYKSTSYRALGTTLPSQQYSFWIVREAIRRQKPIVIMRSERVWLESVPELRSYSYIRLRNNQNPYLSSGQMTPDQFNQLVNALS